MSSKRCGLCKQKNPEDLFQPLNDALNAGDVETPLSYLSDDVNVFINPKRDFHGKDEIRGWYEFLVADNTSVEISNFQTEGEICTWDWKVSGVGIKAGGDEYVVITMEGAAEDGQVEILLSQRSKINTSFLIAILIKQRFSNK